MRMAHDNMKARRAPSTTIGALSDEVHLEILRFCKPRELAAASCVSVAWRRLASDDYLWDDWLTAEFRLHRPVSQTCHDCYAALRLAGRAATLLGEWEYVGFFDEVVSFGSYTMAFWLRAWAHKPPRESRGGGTGPRIVGSINYVLLNPPPEGFSPDT